MPPCIICIGMGTDAGTGAGTGTCMITWCGGATIGTDPSMCIGTGT